MDSLKYSFRVFLGCLWALLLVIFLIGGLGVATFGIEYLIKLVTGNETFSLLELFH